MMFKKTTTIKVLGRVVAEIEQDFGGVGGPERVYRPIPKKSEMQLPTNLLVPLALDSMVSLTGVVPGMISFGEGAMLEKDGNVDSAVACEALKKSNLSKAAVVKVVLGFVGQTNLFSPENNELRAAFRDHVASVVDANWDLPQPQAVK